jgi:hypothetical protein
MDGGTLTRDIKRTSVLRRIPPPGIVRYAATPGFEGDVCAFELTSESSPMAVEAASGRPMTLAPGDVFLATGGYRESTRWVVGRIPDGGLVPGIKYWILSESGVVGDLIADSSRAKSHLGQVKYLGAVCDDEGQILNIRQFATNADEAVADHGAPVFLVLGTSAEVGKTTAGTAVLRTLRHKGHTTVVVLKATGTSSFTELAHYLDFGATQVFDCVDFGLPTTYPSDREGMASMFVGALDICLSISADAVVVECGGDILGANVPIFLKCLVAKRPDVKIILAAADALGALGAKSVLRDMGLSPNLISGPCTDTPILQQRTRELCGVPAINLFRDEKHDELF